jgi:hypothetical protein
MTYNYVGIIVKYIIMHPPKYISKQQHFKKYSGNSSKITSHKSTPLQKVKLIPLEITNSLIIMGMLLIRRKLKIIRLFMKLVRKRYS